MPILRIIRGLPGSGKSTLAKSYGAVHFEVDMFHTKDNSYQWKAENVYPSHRWCKEVIHHCMKLGMDVVTSNVFTKVKHFADYIDMAKSMGYTVEVIRCADSFGNIHNVPDDTLKKMKDRFQDYEHEIVIRNTLPKVTFSDEFAEETGTEPCDYVNALYISDVNDLEEASKALHSHSIETLNKKYSKYTCLK